HQHRALDLGKVSLRIEKTSAGGECNQGAHGVHEGHDEHGEHNWEGAPGQGATQIELPEKRANAGRHAYEMGRRGSGARQETNDRSNHDSYQDCTGYLPDDEHRNQNESANGYQHRRRRDVAGADWRSGNTQSYDS